MQYNNHHVFHRNIKGYTTKKSAVLAETRNISYDSYDLP